MKLGIDFGTTRIVTAVADRGNYPVVSFDGPDGESRDWYPPVVAVRGEERLYGWEAWTAQGEPGWTVMRSIKRLLGESGPETPVEIGGRSVPMHRLLSELLGSLRRSLVESSTLRIDDKEPLEVFAGVPANANNNQRFLTAEAFRSAGFILLGMLNEPSAAGVEFCHGGRATGASRAGACLLVYDFGGGTFDASLVELGDPPAVVAVEGLSTLGGDDFDEILAELALDAAGIDPGVREGLSPAESFRLLEECRQKKEALHPATRKIGFDLDIVREGWGQVVVPVADFSQRCQPIVEDTLRAVESLLGSGGPGGGAPVDAAGQPAKLDALYMTGGASELPVVARMLRERFGRRVRRSVQARSATAVGLAIHADGEAGTRIRDRFTRHFGVWREAEGGRKIAFDPLFVKMTPLPAPGDGPLRICRAYRPVHNIGHFRYLECSHLDDEGRPAGDITFWDEIRFPFDPDLRGLENVDAIPVGASDSAARQWVEEAYSCDVGGTINVTITNETAGYERSYRLGRWSSSPAPVRPGRRKRRPGAGR